MAENSAPCSIPEANQFDFWLGEWDVTWGDDGQGTNKVERIFDGCVILENFDGSPSMAFKGMSVSTYNTQLGQWQQTWVDNQGSYLDFIGEFKDGRMILSREAIIEDKLVQQRMVWYSITPNALEWNWDRSEDVGKTWQTLWHIHYKRKVSE